jgi:quercetin dioxygenase-like cupin family protein
MKVAASIDIIENPVTDTEAENVFMKMLAGPADGAENFFLRQFRVAPGGYTPLHQHDWEHEVFILSGRGEVHSGQGPRTIAAGHVVFIPPGERHQFKNTGASDLEFLCIVPASSDS